MIIGDHSLLTGHTRDEVLSKHSVEDPLVRLDRLTTQRISKASENGYLIHSEGLARRWQQLLDNIAAPITAQPQQMHRNTPKQQVLCEICGLAFQDPAALKFASATHQGTTTRT